MTQSTELKQPREGVVGELRDQDDLLSLKGEAYPRRLLMTNLAYCIYQGTLIGNPPPNVRDLNERIRHPQIGDLVVETSTVYFALEGLRAQAFGILLDKRVEWAHTEGGWRQALHDGDYDQDDQRPQTFAWYVQYGPQPDDITRWTNCDFIAVPTFNDELGIRW